MPEKKPERQKASKPKRAQRKKAVPEEPMAAVVLGRIDSDEIDKIVERVEALRVELRWLNVQLAVELHERSYQERLATLRRMAAAILYVPALVGPVLAKGIKGVCGRWYAQLKEYKNRTGKEEAETASRQATT